MLYFCSYPGTCPGDYWCYSRGYAIARCQAKTTLKSYWHELRDHQEYSKKIAMKTGTHTQVPVPMIQRQRGIGLESEAATGFVC